MSNSACEKIFKANEVRGYSYFYGKQAKIHFIL